MLTGLLTTALLTRTSAASAQSPTELKRAQTLFDEGDKLEVGGSCDAAVEKFREALKIVETPQLRLRIGRCQEKAGRLVDAANEYDRAIQAAGDDKLAAVAKGLLDGVSKRLGTLRMSLTSEPAPPGLKVVVDGRDLRDWNRSQRLSPGSHKVSATADGYASFERTFDVAAGQTELLAITLTPSSEPPPPPTEPAAPTSRYGVLPWVLVGTGAAFTAGGVGMIAGGVVSRNAGFTTLQDSGLCPDAPKCPKAFETSPPSDPAWDEAEGQLSTANILYGVGAAAGVVGLGLLGAGIGLAVSNGPADDQPKAALVVPWATSEGAGVVVLGAF